MKEINDKDIAEKLKFLMQFQNKQHGIIALKKGLTFEEADKLGLR